MEKTKIITIAIMVIIVLIASISMRFKTRKQYEVSKVFRLFPFWIKYLGIVLSIASILFHWKTLSDEPTILHSFWEFGLVIGLILICLSNERNEDEMTMSIRLNAIFISFFTGILAHLFIVLIEILDGGNVNSYNSLFVTIYMLIMYVIIFHITKKRLR